MMIFHSKMFVYQRVNHVEPIGTGLHVPIQASPFTRSCCWFHGSTYHPHRNRMFSGGRLNQPVICSYNEDICYPEKEDRESTILYIYNHIYLYIYIIQSYIYIILYIVYTIYTMIYIYSILLCCNQLGLKSKARPNGFFTPKGTGTCP